jgi:putative glutathione S-transferase
LVEVDARDPTHGWYFSGKSGAKDRVSGVRWLKELYLKADLDYKGRITIPVLWDRQQGTNQSLHIGALCADRVQKL